MLLIFFIGCRPDKADMARGKIWLQKISHIQAAAAHCPRTDDVMNLIQIKDWLFHPHKPFHNLLKALFKISAILRPR